MMNRNECAYKIAYEVWGGFMRTSGQYPGLIADALRDESEQVRQQAAHALRVDWR